MCNRYQLRSSLRKIRQAFGVTTELFEPAIPAEYFPGSVVPVIRGAQQERELLGIPWGIQLGRHRVTNSRDDKIDSVWKRFMSSRVVFPVDRAIEWHYGLDLFGQPSGKPKPWSIERADGEPAAIAGIASDQGVSMLTCPADDLYRDVHNKSPEDPRMVVYLVEAEDVNRWLDRELSLDEIRPLIRPAPAGWLVGSPLNPPAI